MLTWLSVDEIFLPRFANWSTKIRGWLLNKYKAPSWWEKTRRSSEKFKGWSRYSHRMWPNEICLFIFYEVFFEINSFLPSVLQCFAPTTKKDHQQQIWCHHMNLSAYELLAHHRNSIIRKLYQLTCAGFSMLLLLLLLFSEMSDLSQCYGIVAIRKLKERKKNQTTEPDHSYLKWRVLANILR